MDDFMKTAAYKAARTLLDNGIDHVKEIQFEMGVDEYGFHRNHFVIVTCPLKNGNRMVACLLEACLRYCFIETCDGEYITGFKNMSDKEKTLAERTLAKASRKLKWAARPYRKPERNCFA